MKINQRRHLCRVITISRRYYATKYVAKITSTSPSGRTLSAEVSTPTLPADPRGYPIPRHHLICKITQIITKSHSDPFYHLSQYLSSLSPTLTTNEVSLILKSIKCPSLALKFFHFCPSLSPNFRHDAFTYSRLFLIFSKSFLSDRFDTVRSLLNDMLKSGIRGNISTVNILIGFFGNTEDLDTCKELVKKWDLQMNAYTYKCLVQAYLRSRDSEQAFSAYEEMKRKGYKLDIFAFNMLLNALAKDEKVDQAYMVFQDMKQKHCQPDEYTYTIMIRLNGKLGRCDESLKLFDEMIAKGCSLNLMAYNTMIQALANGRMVDKVIYLFSKMVERDCRPNEFTYSVILNVLVAEGRLNKLDEVVEVSKKYMNKSIYAYLVRTLSKLGHASEAHRFFCNMWSFHDKGDKDAYMSMLESLCSAGKTTEALDLLSKIHEKGITTDTVMYNTSSNSEKEGLKWKQKCFQSENQEACKPRAVRNIL
ncbi:hypothetical protein COLO4_27631 [Corchorus olitorius]|uniref:PROP1-like PPR domain-containing protein n=1 Tax=Corchorus olitorius TaxID=93759 RepID=A0A1R3HPT4_9ROSI|nr:hypothetical protein COLO4_27631 [Corchorus olitorius]